MGLPNAAHNLKISKLLFLHGIYNHFRKDNIVFALCMSITTTGSLVIFIKKIISRQIIQRIPKSNILPQPTNDQDKSLQMATLHSTPKIIQVGLINENGAGDLSLLGQSSSFQLKKWYLDYQNNPQ